MPILILSLFVVKSFATDYYFRNVNNSGSTTTNWSLTDGGASAGVVPGINDNAIFTANSYPSCNWNVTNGTLTGLIFNGYTGTFIFTNAITISSTLTFSSGMAISGSGNISINNNCTVTFNGKTFPNAIILTVAGKTLTLTDAAKIYSLVSTASTSASHNIIKSNSSGAQRSLHIPNYGNMDLTFVDFTDINASSGLPIITYKGIISNCTNVFNHANTMIAFTNSKAFGIVANGSDLNANQYSNPVLTFLTNKSGTFNPYITASGALTWNFGDGSSLETTNTPSHTYSDASVKTVNVYRNNASATIINLSSQLLQGFVTCKLTAVTNYNFASNSALNRINFTSSSAVITNLYAYSCNVDKFDFSNLSNIGGDLRIYSNSNDTALVLPTINQQFTNINASNNALNRWSVDQLFKKLNIWYLSHPPTQNLTITINGGTNSAPTGGNSNTDIVSLGVIFNAAGKFINITKN